MYKTIGRSAQPNIGSKTKIFPRCYPRPHRVGLPPPLNPPVVPLVMQSAQRRGGSAPLLSPRLTTWASHGKNITKPNILPLVFFPQGATRELSHLSSPVMPIISLHQENFLELTNFANASAVFFKVSTFTSNTFLSSIISFTK